MWSAIGRYDQATRHSRGRPLRRLCVQLGLSSPYANLHQSVFRFAVALTQLRKVGECVAVDAVIHLRSILKSHAAEASAEGAALVDFEIAPFPNAEIFGDGIAVVPHDLKDVGILRDKSIVGGAHEDRQDVRRLDREPLAANSRGREMMMEVAFQLERLLAIDPSKETDRGGVASLEIGAALLNVLGDADLDAAVAAILISDEIYGHRVYLSRSGREGPRQQPCPMPLRARSVGPPDA